MYLCHTSTYLASHYLCLWSSSSIRVFAITLQVRDLQGLFLTLFPCHLHSRLQCMMDNVTCNHFSWFLSFRLLPVRLWCLYTIRHVFLYGACTTLTPQASYISSPASNAMCIMIPTAFFERLAKNQLLPSYRQLSGHQTSTPTRLQETIPQLATHIGTLTMAKANDSVAKTQHGGFSCTKIYGVECFNIVE